MYKKKNKLFSNHSYNPRIYVYSKNGEKVKIPYENCIVKYYIHKRATRPYFILRFASVEMVKKWKNLVANILETKELYHYVLRGFFAGEGNISEGSHGHRTPRISQGKKKKFIDDLLIDFGIKYSFRLKERSYNISGKWNWDIFAKYKLADLHPNKKEKILQQYKNRKISLQKAAELLKIDLTEMLDLIKNENLYLDYTEEELRKDMKGLR